MENEAVKSALTDHRNFLCDTEISGPTSAFWYSFIDMMNTLLLFLRSIKTANWPAHLQATRLMIPYMFAYDRPNYFRFLTYYWAEMTQLPKLIPASMSSLCEYLHNQKLLHPFFCIFFQWKIFYISSLDF